MCDPLGIVFAAYGWALPYNLYFFRKITGHSFFEYIPIIKIINLISHSLMATLPVVLLGLFKLTPIYELIISLFLYITLYVYLIKNFKNELH